MSLAPLIFSAYNPTYGQNIEIPEQLWAINDGFDIEAKGPDTAASADVNLMVRALLEDRFALKTHIESREVPVYALVPARGDKRLPVKMIDVTGKPCPDLPFHMPSGLPRCGLRISAQLMDVQGATMKQLAQVLTQPEARIGRRVIDRTEIPGEFDIKLEFAFPERNPAPAPNPDNTLSGFEAAWERTRLPDSDLAALFKAIEEQMGLKLEPTRAIVEILVVDSFEKPNLN